MEKGELPVAIGSERPVYITIKLDRENKYDIRVDIIASKDGIFKMSQSKYIFKAGNIENIITGVRIDLALYEYV